MVDAALQAWPPFILVAGLLMIGAAAAADGLFESIGARLASGRLPPRALLVALLALVAVVTAVLNLDTSVVFLTPVLVHAARRRGVDERPFLYGSVFMANSASLLLPGSNLTNLLVLGGGPRPDMLRARVLRAHDPRSSQRCSALQNGDTRMPPLRPLRSGSAWARRRW
jgi:arsenical pump membrane protein